MIAKPAITNGTTKKKKDSSSSEDSSDSDDNNAAKKLKLANNKSVPVKTVKKEKSSDSSSEDDSEDEKPTKTPQKTTPIAKKVNAKKESSSSDSSSDDSDNEKAKKTKPEQIKTAKLSPSKTSTPHFKPVQFVSAGFDKPQQKEDSSSSEDDSSDSNNKTATKPNGNVAVGNNKRKLSVSSDASSVTKKAKTNDSFNKKNNSNPNSPFRRVKDEEVKVDSRLADNSFAAKVRILFQLISK